MGQRHLLFTLDRENVRDRDDDQGQQHRAPKRQSNRDQLARISVGKVVTVADGEERDDREPERLQIIIKLRTAGSPLIRHLEYSDPVGEHETGREEENEAGLLRFNR